MNYDIAIIGAGAAGLAAAVKAGEFRDKKILVIERLSKPGKKLLVTGNSRCNLTNLHARNHSYNNCEFVEAAFNKFDVPKTLDFFKTIGLFTVSDSQGRVYPMSNTAESVQNSLFNAALSNGVEFMFDTSVNSIEKNGELFIINNSFTAVKVIIAAGGRASSVHGSDGSGYALLAQFSHTITPLSPALVPLEADMKKLHILKGVKVRGKITIVQNNSELISASGEILFTDSGISGIAAMETSFVVTGNDQYACIDLAPLISAQQMSEMLRRMGKKYGAVNVVDALIGIIPKKMAIAVCRQADIDSFKPISRLSAGQRNKLCECVKAFTLRLTGTRGFENAQITRGGADLSEFYSETMMSKKVDNLFAIGEVLDIDGPCGGYNLQWAWSSALCAAQAAVN